MDLHAGLKTEIVGKADADSTQLVLVKIIRSKDNSIQTLHANPTSFSFSGLQTEDVLSIIGFESSRCAFIPGNQCFVREVEDNFDLTEFARVFPIGNQALKDSEKLLLDCGFTLRPDQRSPLKYRYQAHGDGHTSPTTKEMKEGIDTDNLFNYSFTWIEGGENRGWVTHIWPVNTPFSHEHKAIIESLGFKRFGECPSNDFNPCWWVFTPFESRGDDIFSSNADIAHRRVDNLKHKFAPAIEKILTAHKAFSHFGMPFIKISDFEDLNVNMLPEIDVKPKNPAILSYMPTDAKSLDPAGLPEMPVIVEPTEREYDVAISYASEDIVIPEALADILKNKGVKVFFDKIYEAELWGKDLFRQFHHVFNVAARYCIVFSSANYAKKKWTNHELRSAQERALEQGDSEYILPVRLDDTNIPGLHSTTGYIDARVKTVDEIAVMVMKKLGK